jgi:hydroxypyruvate isomerase
MSQPSPLRFAANLHFLFTEVPFLERFAAAAGAGFRAVEFPDAYAFPADEIAARLREHRLACVLLNLPMGDRSRGELGLACLPDRRDDFRDSLALGIATARALGCPQLNCMAGRAPAGVPRDELAATFIDNLQLACAEAARAGLRLLVEPLNTIERPGLFLDGSAQAISIMDAVGADNLRLQFDCYHLHLMEGGLLASLDRWLPRIGHVQVADAPGRHQPGSGEIPYPAIFRLLAARAYSGWIGAEYHPAGPTEASLRWLPPESKALDGGA